MRSMTIEMEVEEALRRWPYIMKQVMDHGARVLLLHKGRPIGGLVGREDKEFLDQHRTERGPPPQVLN